MGTRCGDRVPTLLPLLGAVGHLSSLPSEISRVSKPSCSWWSPSEPPRWPQWDSPGPCTRLEQGTFSPGNVSTSPGVSLASRAYWCPGGCWCPLGQDVGLSLSGWVGFEAVDGMWGSPHSLWMGCRVLPVQMDVRLSHSLWMGCGILPVPMDRLWGSPCPHGRGDIEPWHSGNALGIIWGFSCRAVQTRRMAAPFPHGLWGDKEPVWD